MRVVVTGHHGYIGSAIVPMLLAAGHEVLGLDTYFYEGCDLFPDTTAFQTLRIDVRDVEAGHLDGAAAVVHLAALSNDPLGSLDPSLTQEINFAATVRLARLARERGVERFVFASSCSMYGAADTSVPLDETAPLAPLTAYATSKVLSEHALRELGDDDFSPVLLRNATAFGVSPRLRIDIVLNNLVGWAVAIGRVRLLSDGSAWRPLVHVEDIGRAVLAVLEAPRGKIHGEAFNVGSDVENRRIVELAEIVRDTVEGASLEIADQATDSRSYRVSFSKFAESFPERVPTWTAADGARELLNAYHAAGLGLDALEGDRFVRLNRLRRLTGEGRLDDELRWRAQVASA